MEKNYTRGPWEAKIETKEFCDSGDYITLCTIEADGVCLAQCFDKQGKISEEQEEANLKLMAAAPELLEALLSLSKYVRRQLTLDNVPEDQIEFILKNTNVAIKKATE